MGVTLSITESLGQDIMLCYPPSPISTPPALPSLLHTIVFLLFSPSLPVSLHKLICHCLLALPLSLLWMFSDELLKLKSVSDSGRYEEGCSTTIANHSVKRRVVGRCSVAAESAGLFSLCESLYALYGQRYVDIAFV